MIITWKVQDRLVIMALAKQKKYESDCLSFIRYPDMIYLCNLLMSVRILSHSGYHKLGKLLYVLNTFHHSSVAERWIFFRVEPYLSENNPI